jgi:hypothetical protein
MLFPLLGYVGLLSLVLRRLFVAAVPASRSKVRLRIFSAVDQGNNVVTLPIFTGPYLTMA